MTLRPLVVALSTLALASTAFAAKTKLLSIGEVTATAPEAKSKLTLVRSSLEAELDTIDWRKSTKMKPYVVSVSVVGLATERTSEKVTTTCELNTTVRSLKDGAVVAILTQRSRAENDASHARAVEEGAIRAATTSAIRRIPTALEESKRR